MYGNVTMFGIFFLLVNIVTPILSVFVMIWIYRIKENSKIQVKQNEEIIQLLKRGYS